MRSIYCPLKNGFCFIPTDTIPILRRTAMASGQLKPHRAEEFRVQRCLLTGSGHTLKRPSRHFVEFVLPTRLLVSSVVSLLSYYILATRRSIKALSASARSMLDATSVKQWIRHSAREIHQGEVCPETLPSRLCQSPRRKLIDKLRVKSQRSVEPRLSSTSAIAKFYVQN
jgi:hypothetical protein